MYIDKSIAIAILARDCGGALTHNIPKIDNLRKYFKSSIVIVVENDSKDNTKEILSNWRDNSKDIIIISEDYNIQTIPPKTKDCKMPGASTHRIEKMCFYRNKYLEYLKKMSFEYDYLMVIDIDIDDFSEEGIVQAINNAPCDWAALFANGRYYFDFFGIRLLGRYYDLFAYVPYNDHNITNENTDLTFREVSLHADLLSIKAIKKKRYMECCSAFGGIAVYKTIAEHLF